MSPNNPLFRACSGIWRFATECVIEFLPFYDYAIGSDDTVRNTWISTFRFNESNHRRNTVITIWTFLHVLYTKVCQSRV